MQHKMKKAAKGKKMILYAPTHRKEGKEPFPLEENFDFERLNQWCKKHQTVFVIKKHFYHREEETDPDHFANIFYKADKLSRDCLHCEAKEECYWPEEKKNNKYQY